MKHKKTNALRILESKNIPHKVIAYEVNESDLSALHVATQLNEPIENVFKTLVVCGSNNSIFVCIIPGAEELDLKKAAKIT